MTEKRCETCAMWDGPHDGSARELDSYECHRFPPSVPVVERVTELGVEIHLLNEGNDVMMMTYPRTYFDEWCGEWRECE